MFLSRISWRLAPQERNNKKSLAEIYYWKRAQARFHSCCFGLFLAKRGVRWGDLFSTLGFGGYMCTVGARPALHPLRGVKRDLGSWWTVCALRDRATLQRSVTQDISRLGESWDEILSRLEGRDTLYHWAYLLLPLILPLLFRFMFFFLRGN